MDLKKTCVEISARDMIWINNVFSLWYNAKVNIEVKSIHTISRNVLTCVPALEF